MKIIKTDKIRKILKKDFLSLSLLILFSFVFFQEFNLFRNIYNLLTKDFVRRTAIAYENTFFSGDCNGASHGYLFYLKSEFGERFGKNQIPKIINNFDGKEDYWVFYNVNAKISDKHIIILNNQNNIDYEKYQVLNKNNERCFLIEKKND